MSGTPVTSSSRTSRPFRSSRFVRSGTTTRPLQTPPVQVSTVTSDDGSVGNPPDVPSRFVDTSTAPGYDGFDNIFSLNLQLDGPATRSASASNTIPQADTDSVDQDTVVQTGSGPVTAEAPIPRSVPQVPSRPNVHFNADDSVDTTDTPAIRNVQD